MAEFAERAKRISAFFAKVFSSSLTYIILFAIFGAALVSTGFYLLFNLGLSLIIGGCFFLLYMGIIYRGMING